MYGFLPLQYRPGSARDLTHFAAQNTWWDMDKVRFNNGLIEKIGGWAKVFTDTIYGIPRSLKEWVRLDGEVHLSFGTTEKYYTFVGGMVYDITPLRTTTNPLGSDPIDTTNTSTTVEVTDTAHGAGVGDWVTISGATAVGGISADTLNAEHKITEVPDANTFRFEVASAATSTATGGGSSVVAAYQIRVGTDQTIFGSGWGAGGWGEDGWGDPSTTTVAGQFGPRLWSQDNYGEDLIFCDRDLGIYYYDVTNPSTRAVAIEDLAGASNAVTIAREISVSSTARHVIAYGCDSLANPGVQDKLLIRWSDSENVADWTPNTDDTSGSIRIEYGTEIITHLETRQDTLVWTDSSVHSFQYVGGLAVYGSRLLSATTTIVGPNSKAAIGDVVYWMGRGKFFVYNGQVRSLPCPVQDFVFNDFNDDQRLKVFAGSNQKFGEIIWFYPSANSDENDRYVVYNYEEDVWYFGSMERSCWLDRGRVGYPIAGSPDLEVFYQEYEYNDGSVNPPAAIPAYAETAPIDIDEGYQMMRVKKFIADMHFESDGLGDTSPQVTLTLKGYNYPGSPVLSTQTGTVSSSTLGTVQAFTTTLPFSMRARMVTLRIESSGKGFFWRMGLPRLEARINGRKE